VSACARVPEFLGGGRFDPEGVESLVSEPQGLPVPPDPDLEAGEVPEERPPRDPIPGPAGDPEGLLEGSAGTYHGSGG
jgi:hypothetical protein